MVEHIYHAVFKHEDPFAYYYPKATHSVVHHAQQITNPNSILALWGGEDISPALYQRAAIRETGAGATLSKRDQTEVRLSLEAIDKNIPIFGVCRGAQLGCAMAGGILVQHTTGHTGGAHMLTFRDDFRAPMSTLHHQMMFPWNIDHELFAWTGRRSSVYLGVTPEEEAKITVEPEVVNFPKIKLFAVQGHPEYMDPNSPAVRKIMGIFNEIYKIK